MAQINFRRSTVLLFSTVAIVIGVFAVTAAVAIAPLPPINDDYINSLSINSPGTRLNRTDTIKDVRDTSSATVQSDIFNPPQHGGPAEVTRCHGVSYGKTIWYDFYPDADGTVRIRTSGFDNVITLYRFNRHTLLPGTHQCVHQGNFPSEELDAPVKQGLAYTIQIGAVNGAGNALAPRPLEFLFDYFAQPPRRLTAESTLTARATSTGIRLLGLSVSTSRGAHVTVDCGRFCPSQTKFGRAVEKFPNLAGRNLPAHSQLHIRVTASHSIGVFIQYNIVAGNFTKQIRCTEPGSRKPRTRCH
jgi:hypothetical protein